MAKISLGITFFMLGLTSCLSHLNASSFMLNNVGEKVVQKVSASKQISSPLSVDFSFLSGSSHKKPVLVTSSTGSSSFVKTSESFSFPSTYKQPDFRGGFRPYVPAAAAANREFRKFKPQYVDIRNIPWFFWSTKSMFDYDVARCFALGMPSSVKGVSVSDYGPYDKLFKAFTPWLARSESEFLFLEHRCNKPYSHSKSFDEWESYLQKMEYTKKERRQIQEKVVVGVYNGTDLISWLSAEEKSKTRQPSKGN